MYKEANSEHKVKIKVVPGLNPEVHQLGEMTKKKLKIFLVSKPDELVLFCLFVSRVVGKDWPDFCAIRRRV